MGKHDKTVEPHSVEYLENLIERLKAEIKELKAENAFANETISKLQTQCGRMSKWASEIESNAEDKITELEAENAKLRGKILKLVESYV